MGGWVRRGVAPPPTGPEVMEGNFWASPEIHLQQSHEVGKVRGGVVWNPPLPLCDIPSGCYSFTGPWTVTRSSLRMLRRVAAFCRLLRPVLLLVLFLRSRSPVVGVLGLCMVCHLRVSGAQ